MAYLLSASNFPKETARDYVRPSEGHRLVVVERGRSLAAGTKPQCRLVSAFTRCDSNPRAASGCKSTVYGLNGLRPMLRGCLLHLNPRTAFRAFAPAASFHGELSCRFVFGQKIWQMIFFSSKANSQIFPKLLTKPRPGSPSPRNSRAMVLLCCPRWDTLSRGVN
jgi:hypothetical protein